MKCDLRNTVSALVAGLVLAGATPAFAQDATGSDDAPAEVAANSDPAAESSVADVAEVESDESAPQPIGAALGATLLEKLAAQEGEMTATIQAVTAELEALGNDEQRAEEIFEEMAAAIERQAALGDPNGDFVLELEKLVEQAHATLVDARELGDEEVVAETEDLISGYEAVRQDAIDLHADSFRALREIRSQKSKFVLRIRVGKLANALEVAQSGVEVMREFNTRINDIKDTIAPAEDESDVVRQ